ncbi:hypothetical protein ACFPN7_26255 [Amycolatopsis halotolerans]|uniref:hypothetical protein n=1 Tax=Amycolatopsis halotolerans TaxID=330083 RepID=UPI00360D12CF
MSTSFEARKHRRFQPRTPGSPRGAADPRRCRTRMSTAAGPRSPNPAGRLPVTAIGTGPRRAGLLGAAGDPRRERSPAGGPVAGMPGRRRAGDRYLLRPRRV